MISHAEGLGPSKQHPRSRLAWRNERGGYEDDDDAQDVDEDDGYDDDDDDDDDGDDGDDDYDDGDDGDDDDGDDDDDDDGDDDDDDDDVQDVDDDGYEDDVDDGCEDDDGDDDHDDDQGEDDGYDDDQEEDDDADDDGDDADADDDEYQGDNGDEDSGPEGDFDVHVSPLPSTPKPRVSPKRRLRPLQSKDPVLDYFRRLLKKIEPTQAELARYASHQNTAARRLNSYLGAEVLKVGSHGRGSGVRWLSDLDLFCILPQGSVLWGSNRKTSRTVLGNVKAQLESRFKGTEVRIDGPSVSVYFQDGAYTVDIVPALSTERPGVYEIPSAEGGWMHACPAQHNEYLRNRDRESGGKLRRISLLLKYWARRAKLPLHSFTAEMIIGALGVCRGARRYSECLREALATLIRFLDISFPDPLGVSDSLYLVDTAAKRERQLRALSAGLRRIDAAIGAESRGDLKTALRHYDRFFRQGRRRLA